MPGSAAPAQRPLWTCPKCRQHFVTRNMWHSCVSLTEEEFFGARRKQRQLYRAFLKLVKNCGPVTVNVTKSRISIQARVRFAGVARVASNGIVCGFWLKRRIEHPRLKVQHIPPNNYVYQFKVTKPSDLDDEVAAWIGEAYGVGLQRK